MKCNFKKLTSLFAAVAMVITTAAVPVFAAGENDWFDNFTRNGSTLTLKENVSLSNGIQISKEILAAKGISEPVIIDLDGHTVTVTGDVNAVHNEDADVTVKNGTIKMDSSVDNKDAYLVYNSGKMTVEGLTVNGKRGALYNYNAGELTVNSGTFTASNYHALYNDNYTSKVTINNGSFGSVCNVLGNITINDGTFESNLYSSGNVAVAENGEWVYTENFIYVNGGKFKNDPAKINNIKIKESRLTKLDNGYYVLGDIPENIAVYTPFGGGTPTYYQTVDQIANCEKSVKLLKDIDLEKDLTIKSSNLLDLNGYNITSSNGSKIIRNDGGEITNTNKEITSTVDVEIYENAVTNACLSGNTIFNGTITLKDGDYPTEASATFNAAIEGSYEAAEGAKFSKKVFTDPNAITVLLSSCIIVDTNDGYYTCMKAPVKNTTQNKLYTSIEEAITEANKGDKIQLQTNISDTVVIPADKEIVLDLAAKNITKDTNEVVIENNGKLTIQNTYSGTPTISGTVNNYGTLIIKANTGYPIRTPRFTDEIQQDWCENGFFPYQEEGGLYTVAKISIRTSNFKYTAEGTDGSLATGFTTQVYSSAQFNISDIKWSVTVGNETKNTGTQELGNIETKSVRLGVIINGIKDDAAVAKASVTASGFVVNEK